MSGCEQSRASRAPVDGAEAKPVSSLVPAHCTGSALAFDPGVLHVSKDGSGYIAIDEDDFACEDDRCEGPDGPEGSVHWITRLSADSMTAMRDFLNGVKLPAPASPDAEMVRALKKIEGGNFDGAATLALAGDFRGIVERLQVIAREALSKHGGDRS